MCDNEPLDRSHLLSYAQALFPGAMIDVIHTPDEITHIDVDGQAPVRTCIDRRPGRPELRPGRPSNPHPCPADSGRRPD